MKNPRNTQATALKFDPLKDSAPIISALGFGHVADRIIKTAKENDVPIVENQPLSEVLTHLSVGDSIPPRLYEAVANILAYISHKDGTYRKYDL